MVSQFEVLLVSQMYAAFIFFNSQNTAVSSQHAHHWNHHVKARILSTSALNWRDDMAEAIRIRLEKLELRLLTKHAFVWPSLQFVS